MPCRDEIQDLNRPPIPLRQPFDFGIDRHRRISTTRLFRVSLRFVNSAFIVSYRSSGSKTCGYAALEVGAKGGTRTPMTFRPPDPKSGASASSATFASGTGSRSTGHVRTTGTDTSIPGFWLVRHTRRAVPGTIDTATDREAYAPHRGFTVAERKPLLSTLSTATENGGGRPPTAASWIDAPSPMPF